MTNQERYASRREYHRNYNRVDYANNTAVHKLRGRKTRERDIEKNMLRRAVRRAKEHGYPCTITLADIVVPEFCPLLGIKLSYASGGTSPSLDKMKPELGYVPGNVWVISSRANTIKQDATLDELTTLIKNWGLMLWARTQAESGTAFVPAEKSNKTV